MNQSIHAGEILVDVFDPVCPPTCASSLMAADRERADNVQVTYKQDWPRDNPPVRVIAEFSRADGCVTFSELDFGDAHWHPFLPSTRDCEVALWACEAKRELLRHSRLMLRDNAPDEYDLLQQFSAILQANLESAKA